MSFLIYVIKYIIYAFFSFQIQWKRFASRQRVGLIDLLLLNYWNRSIINYVHVISFRWKHLDPTSQLVSITTLSRVLSQCLFIVVLQPRFYSYLMWWLARMGLAHESVLIFLISVPLRVYSSLIAIINSWQIIADNGKYLRIFSMRCAKTFINYLVYTFMLLFFLL